MIDQRIKKQEEEMDENKYSVKDSVKKKKVLLAK